ncbi:TolC family protein [Persephonella sp.]
MKKIISIYILLSFSFAYPVTLNELIDLAEKNSPVLKEKALDIKIKEVKKKQIHKKKFGEIHLFGSFNRFEDPRILYPITPPIDPRNLVGAKNQFITGISYSVPIFTGFEIEKNTEISILAKRVKEIEYLLTKNQLIYNIKSIYLKILSLQKQKKALISYKQSLIELYKNIQESVKVGKKPEVDLLKVDYQIESVEAEIEKVKNSIYALKSALKTIIGKKDINLSVIEDVRLTELDNFNRTQLLKNINSLDTLKQATLSEEISEKKVKIAQGKYLPKIYFTASAQRNMGNSEYKDLWQVGFIVEYTFFDFGRRKHEYIQSKLELKKAKLQKKTLRLKIIQKIDEALSEIKTAISKIKASEKQLLFAKEVEKIEKAKYEEGVSDLYDYLLAKSQRFLAESSYYQAIYEKESAISYLQYILEEFKNE